ncbi:MAG: hypothetical protein ABJB12_02300 [Pseudomonadota bacterium]
MARKCELCAKLKTRSPVAEQSPRPAKLKRVLVEDRVLALCDVHAAKVRSLAPVSVTELRQSFTERRGKRSLLERRAAADRRAFPARPEGRRASSGRRATDSNE